jgi:hypothetical protein
VTLHGGAASGWACAPACVAPLGPAPSLLRLRRPRRAQGEDGVLLVLEVMRILRLACEFLSLQVVIDLTFLPHTPDCSHPPTGRLARAFARARSMGKGWHSVLILLRVLLFVGDLDVSPAQPNPLCSSSYGRKSPYSGAHGFVAC